MSKRYSKLLEAQICTLDQRPNVGKSAWNVVLPLLILKDLRTLHAGSIKMEM